MNVRLYLNGEPSWQDHGSPDAAKAAEFYTALFGWQCPEGDPEFGGYRSCTLDGQLVAGIAPQMMPGPAAWSVYVNVDSADEVAARVAANGGQVLAPPMTVGEFGRMAVFMDPTGAVIGVWQPNLHPGAEAHGVPGAVCWYELVTSDLVAATAFYAAVFGWAAQAHGPTAGPGGYTEFALGDKTVGGMMAKPPMMPAEVPSHWAVYFDVADTDAAAAQVAALGGQVIMGPTDIEPGRFAVVADTTGATFNLLQLKR